MMAMFATILMTLVALYLAVGEPIYGTRSYRRLLREVAVDPTARLRYLKRIMGLEWGLVLLVGLTLWLRSAPLAALGLRLPHLVTDGLEADLVAGGLIGVTIGLVASLLIGAFSAKYRASIRKQLKGAEGLLPATPVERWWWVAVSVTAGICEEVLFRGFLLFYLAGIAGQGFMGMLQTAPRPFLLLALLLSSAIFGLAHLYQGLRGVLSAGLLGLILGWVYLLTGSLLFPVIIHALTDLRILPLLMMADRDARRSA